MAEWIIKHDPTVCCLQETHDKFNDMRAKERKKTYHASINKKHESDQVDFEERKLPWAKRIIPLRKYNDPVIQRTVSKYMKQKLRQLEESIQQICNRHWELLIPTPSGP